jgi:predicted nucleic acid-binding protein
VTPTILVDTNVLLDLFTQNNDWAQWSESQLKEHSKSYQLAINPFIYSETSVAFESVEDLDQVLESLKISVVELSRPALFLAAQAHVHYRKQGGVRAKILTDFFIGAHAAAAEMPVITRDDRRYRSYFPDVTVISPPRH